MNLKLLYRAFIYSSAGFCAAAVFLALLRSLVRFTNSLPREQQLVVGGVFVLLLCTLFVYDVILAKERGVEI